MRRTCHFVTPWDKVIVVPQVWSVSIALVRKGCSQYYLNAAAFSPGRNPSYSYRHRPLLIGTGRQPRVSQKRPCRVLYLRLLFHYTMLPSVLCCMLWSLELPTARIVAWFSFWNLRLYLHSSTRVRVCCLTQTYPATMTSWQESSVSTIRSSGSQRGTSLWTQADMRRTRDTTHISHCLLPSSFTLQRRIKR
jgi:hypothetical protein